MNSDNIQNKFIRDLSQGPICRVSTYSGYFINGYRFHTVGYGGSKATSNSGVCIKGTNYITNESDYYGILEEVVQLDYPGLPEKHVVVFKCSWFDPSHLGTKIN